MSDDLNPEELRGLPRTLNIGGYLLKQVARNERLEKALQEIAGSKLFNHYDPTDCTEEVFDEGRALVQTARDAIRRDNA